MKRNISKKNIYIIGICIILISIGYYLYYQHIQQQIILESMNITFNEIIEIEYGTRDYDVKKELIKDVKNAEIKNIPNIDTMKIGEQTLQFILVNEGLEKEIDYQIQIKDTKAPEIKFKEDKIELTVGDKFDIKSNIESVKDPIDGYIKENSEVLELNKKATEEYNKLKKENIKNDTKVAEMSLNEFLIEDIQDKDAKNLYLKNCYYFDGTVEVSKIGKYKVNIVAVDKNGLKSIKGFTITVKGKDVKQSQVNTNQNKSQSQINSSSNHNSSSSSTSKGSISNVVNTAIAQTGKPYVYGASGPDSFDCSGLLYYSFKQNGYSVPRAIRNAGFSIGKNMANAQLGDIIVSPGHVSMISEKKQMTMTHEGMVVYSFRIIEATTNLGVRQTSQYFPLMVRTDGKVIGTEGQILNDYPYWTDIRRIR